MPLINQVQIFLPMLVLAGLTFIAFLKLAAARAAIAKTMDPGYYRAHIGDPEPEAARAAARHWDNLFELPTLFYAGCITAFVLGAVGSWTLAFAWGFVAARIVQSAIHMTGNNPAMRGLAFVAGVACMLGLWVNLGLSILAAA